MKKTIAILFVLILLAVAGTYCPATTKSPDIDGNGSVDFNDFASIASQWLNSSQGEPNVSAEWIADYNFYAGKDDPYGMVVDNSGNVYVTGKSWSGNVDYVTIKYDTNGHQLWATKYNGPAKYFDTAYAITVDGSGNSYVTGTSDSSDTSESGDYATIKYDPNGVQLWVDRYDGPGHREDLAKAITSDKHGNIYVTGQSYGGLETGYDYATIKYSPNGSRLWVKRYNGPENLDEYATAITTDIFGNIIVTGTGTTIKYDPNGSQLWAALNGFAVKDVVSDNTGNIYITGRSFFSGNSWDYTTIKYDPNGNQIWVALYDGPANSDDWANAITIDNIGNIYVTGYGIGSIETWYDYATVKYDPNGTQLWEARYDGPDSDSDSANDIITDNDGNIYVTGQSRGLGTGSDYATIKYDTNGNQIWVARFNGRNTQNDFSYLIAKDNFGHIYVSGQANYSGFNDSIVTIKYSQDLICQTEFDGDLNSDCKVDINDLALFAQHWLDKAE